MYTVPRCLIYQGLIWDVRGFLKMGIDQHRSFYHGKAMIVGYHNFGKRPHYQWHLLDICQVCLKPVRRSRTGDKTTGTNGRKMIGGTVGGVVGTTDPGRRRPRPPWRKQIDGNGKSKKKSRCVEPTLRMMWLSDESKQVTSMLALVVHVVPSISCITKPWSLWRF